MERTATKLSQEARTVFLYLDQERCYRDTRAITAVTGVEFVHAAVEELRAAGCRIDERRRIGLLNDYRLVAKATHHRVAPPPAAPATPPPAPTQKAEEPAELFSFRTLDNGQQVASVQPSMEIHR